MPAILESRPSGTELARKAWLSIRMGLRQMPIFYSALLVANLLLTVVSFYIERSPGDDSLSIDTHATELALLTIIVPLASLLVFAAAAVPMHRFILLGEGSKPSLALCISILRFFCWTFVIGLMAGLPFLAALLVTHLVSQFYIVLMLAAFCACVFIFVRSAMVLPAVAIGDFHKTWGRQLDASWDQTQGQVWLFIAGAICLGWPFILISFLAAVAASVPGLAGMELPDFENTLAFKLFDDGFVSLAIFVLDAGLASWLYAWVRQQPAAALEPPPDIAPI